MRLKQYIINENRSKSIKYDEALNVLKTKCKQAVKNYNKGSVLYRGIDNNGNYLYVNPKKYTRESSNTMNYYTLINDNSPAWKKYPKRSESIICSTEYSTASDYGDEFVVFPFDNAKIGVCSESDYWFSFDNIEPITSLDDWNYQLERLFKQVDIPLDDTSFKRIQTSFNIFDMTFSKNKESLDILVNEDGFTILDGYDDFNDMMKFIQDTLHPNNNDFDLVKIGQYIAVGKECWTDSKCLLINEKLADSMVNHEIK